MQESSNPTIFVVILNYNGKDTLLSCLSSVYKSDYPKFEVVVVDNDSTDGSFELAKNQFSKVHFIKSPRNIGFAGGNNLGIRFALEKFADYVLVLNNDAYLKKDTLAKLIVAAKGKNLPGIINPLILNANGKRIWFAGGKIRWLEMKNVHLEKITAKTSYETEYCTGCAMFIDKAVFRKIGLFDERYFLYYEDADFSFRAKKAGFELSVSPSAKVCHDEQSTLKNASKDYWLVLSGAIFFFSHGNFFQRLWILGYFQLRKLKNLYLNVFKPSFQVSLVHQAYKDFRKIKLN